MSRHPHQPYFRSNSFLFFFFPGERECAPHPKIMQSCFLLLGEPQGSKHTPTATEETPRANSLPHHAVSFAKQLLHNRARLHEVLSLHNVALSSS